MLAGRAEECARISLLLDEARDGRGGALVVHGEPGIGKTSLLEHAADQAGGMRIVRARGVETETSLPFAGLVDLLTPLTDYLPVRGGRLLLAAAPPTRGRDRVEWLARVEDGMPSTVEDTASCALCHRHLLVGEPARLYQDPQSKRFAKVCPLCYERADRRGWRADGRPIVAVHANPPSDHLLRERESLIDRLRGQLQSVEFDLDRVRSALAKAEQQAAELRGIKRELKDLQGEVRKRERELRSLQDEKRRADERAAQSEAAHKSEIARHHAAAAALDERAAEMTRVAHAQRELEQELETQRTRYTELAEARRKESDPRHVRRVALEAFNRSEHLERVIAISRSLGDPIVNVAVDGLDLPRPVKITIAWDISWYEYIVRLDLLERTVTVEEARRGDDPRELPVLQMQANGVLRADRIVLAMQAYGVGGSAASAL